MKGKRIFELLSELTATENRQLMYQCSKSEDKRLLIFYKVLKLQPSELEEFNQYLFDSTAYVFKGKPADDIEHICRRNLDYYAAQIEAIMIQSHLSSDQKLRSIIIAESLEKSANPFLLEYYYNKAFKNAQLLSDSVVELKALRGKIRLKFNTQTESAYKEAIQLNNYFKINIENFYHDKYVDYYNNISNIYIESNLLIGANEKKLIDEIEIKKNQCCILKYQIGYLISQARLCFKNDLFFIYINSAFELLNKGEIDGAAKNILKRKILFLELIIGFYFNRNQHNLLDVIEDILKVNNENKFIDNNTMFHKLLLLVLNDNTNDALEIIAKEKNYFKGKSSELKEFIMAMVYYKSSQETKCLKIINDLSYCSNYFIALFSKLLSIKIHIELNNMELSESLLYNTERFIKRNSDKYTVFDASLYTVNALRLKIKQKTNNKINNTSIPLSPFHAFLLHNKK